MTPEEYFLGEDPRPYVRSFDPMLYMDDTTQESGQGFSGAGPVFEKKNALDIVICCGSPGAGKSTFYWDYLQPLGYERVNQDILKSVSAVRLPIDIV